MNVRDEIIAGRFNEDRARRVFQNLLKALRVQHEYGYTAYALTASKVLLWVEDYVKLDDCTCPTNQYGYRYKREHPMYASPQSMCGRYDGEKDDAWAAGIILYQMLSGSYPFYSVCRSQLIQNILSGKFDLPEISLEAGIVLHAILRADRPPLKRLLNSRWLQMKNLRADE